MLSTHEIITYLLQHRIGETDYIDAALNDPVLVQAERDGYAVRDDGRWRGLGHIQPGEQRTVRYMDGDVEIIVG